MNRFGAMIGTLAVGRRVVVQHARALPQWSVWVWVKITAAPDACRGAWK